MSELDIIREIAQQVLVVPTLKGTKDNSLWDRTQRLVRNVEHICRLPEVAKTRIADRPLLPDRAAYFSDAGFAHYADAEDTSQRLSLPMSARTTCPIFQRRLLPISSAARLPARRSTR